MIQDTPWTPPFVSTTSATAASTAEAIAGTNTAKFVTPAALSGSVPTLAAPVRNALAPAQALSFNGTAGSTLTLTSTPSGDQTWAFDCDVPASNPSATVGIFNAGGTIGAARTLGCYIISNGQLNFVLMGASGSDYRSATIAGFVSTYAGTRVRCIATMTSGVFALYVNGQVVTTSSTTGGTPPAWGDALANGTVYLGKLDASQYYFTGPLRLLGVENYALSPAQQTYVYQTGSFPASDYGASGAPAGTTVTAGAFVIGKKYRIVSVGTTSFTGIGASANTVGVEFTATGVGTGTGTALAIGLLVAPDPMQPGNGLTWGDRSGNGAHILLPTSGVDWLLPSAAVNKLRGTTSTSGNQQLLGGTTLNANTQITRVRARSRSGTPSITLGTASGGSQIVASVALSTTWKDLTIALTGGIISTASSVWVGSSAADVVEIDLTHEPLGY